MKSLLEKLTLNKDTETIHTFDSLLKAHIAARREATKFEEGCLVLRSNKGEYIITLNYENLKVGDTYDYKLNDDIIKCDVLEVVKK